MAGTWHEISISSRSCQHPQHMEVSQVMGITRCYSFIIPCSWYFPFVRHPFLGIPIGNLHIPSGKLLRQASAVQAHPSRPCCRRPGRPRRNIRSVVNGGVTRFRNGERHRRMRPWNTMERPGETHVTIIYYHFLQLIAPFYHNLLSHRRAW